MSINTNDSGEPVRTARTHSCLNVWSSARRLGHFGQRIDKHQVFEQAALPLQLDVDANARLDNRLVERLGNIVHRAERKSHALVFDVGHGRQEDDGDVLGSWPAP